ncbi:tetratricopeptide repeat protein [Maribellus comscasis]|uniref:Tetratricopeptide repeat protein n=1 Tax=Maribellus comscasis TaxID=2681766 RepID=A0A6I6JNA0_9BACT|nr:tetratricopeptide repeat protein [Maribellus comscasis]QGY42579.1 tetratricopeptide repeat protein [Maribellus comscasis]
MKEKELKYKYLEICENLAGRKLKPAFDLLGKLIHENGLVQFSDEYRTLEETYHYMLKYTVEGIQDPERQKIYRKLIVSVYELADKLNEALKMKFSSSVEYEKKRVFKENYINDFSKELSALEDFYVDKELKSLIEEGEIKISDEKADARNHQQKMVQLFYHFWFRDEYSNEEINFLRKFFSNEQISESYKAFVISSVLLSLQRYFSPEKFELFFELYESEQNEISQRALIALLINFFRYDSRMQYYPALVGRLKILNEDPSFKRNLEQAVLQLVRSRETEKIQQKIKDEIIPEMIKISPNLKDKINLDSLMDDSISDDKNPEWEEIFKESPGLMDKMEEFSELQMEGADVFIGSFSMLKLFPFFNEISNWFIPFFSENPQISQDINLDDELNRKFVETINSAPILCNSDKYSFCFSIQNLPVENREFMAQGMKAEMDQFNEIGKDEEMTAPGKQAGFISNQYVQDLYRFYKLHPRKEGFEDIFSWRFDFHNSETIGEILKEDVKILRNIAEYYFGKNYFDEAVEIYNYLLTIEKGGEIYQKIAFCYQKMGMFRKALDNYQKAELYELNKLWNYKKIALCYRNLKQPASALEYYREAEKIDPENLNIQLSIGHCLLELGEFEEALKCYFKVEYLSPGNKKVWRPIGWCSFVSGKKQQAEKYFQKLIDDEPNKHDLMNMGHVQWSLGSRRKALDFYKKSVEKNDFTEQEFFDVFEEDYHHLVDQGVNQEDVPIMLDQLRYFIEN